LLVHSGTRKIGHKIGHWLRRTCLSPLGKMWKNGNKTSRTISTASLLASYTTKLNRIQGLIKALIDSSHHGCQSTCVNRRSYHRHTRRRNCQAEPGDLRSTKSKDDNPNHKKGSDRKPQNNSKQPPAGRMKDDRQQTKS
jgi:hypothetical protein